MSSINIPTFSVDSGSLPIARSLRSDVQWTLLGYFAYGVCQWLMLIVVARLGPIEMVGQFALAMAVTTPIILLIGLDLRTVQVTDQFNCYPFEDYFTLRVTTLMVAMAVIMGFTFWIGYKRDTTLLIFVMGLAKCVEALSDLCHGTLQQHERLDQIAQARILRGVMSVIAMAGGMYFTQSVLLATVSLAVMWTAILICLDWPLASHVLHERGYSTRLFRFRPKELWALLVPAIPTGILSCQASLEQNLPRFCIDFYLSERDLGIYSAVSSLIIASTMVINAIHGAVLTRMARYVVDDQWGQFWRMLLQLSMFGLILGGLGTAVVAVCGSWILGMALGKDYAAHSSLLVVLMLGATIRYATLPLSVGFRAAKHFWMMCILQTISMVAAIPVLVVQVQNQRGIGAAYASVALAMLFALIQIPAAIIVLKKSERTRLSGIVQEDRDHQAGLRGAA